MGEDQWYLKCLDTCFMCISNNDCNVMDKKIVTQVEYLMPEITIIKMNIPLRICSICQTAIDSFSKFKEFCVKNSLLLEARMKEAQCGMDKNTLDEACVSPDTQPQAGTTDIAKENMEETTEPIIEEIFIKEEPLQEDDPELYNNILQRIPKEEYITDSDIDNQTDKVDNDDIKNNENSVLYSILTGSTKVENGNKDFDCHICHKLFKNKCQLKQHITRIHMKEFPCSICKSMFRENSDLQIHLIQVHGIIKNYNCTICNKLFKHKHTLRMHMKIHDGLKDFTCPTCGKMFIQKCTLIRHMKTHAKVECE